MQHELEQTQKLNFEALQKNLIDVIKENQIKIGYREEVIRLYYQMASINHLLGKNMTIEELDKALEEFQVFAGPCLDSITWKRTDSRYCFAIPEEGVKYVHESVQNPFLEELIHTVDQHGITIEEVLKVFHKYGDKVHFSEEKNGEFDYLVYFVDGKPDSYRYCLKKEGEHIIYHRFTISDYKDFDFA